MRSYAYREHEKILRKNLEGSLLFSSLLHGGLLVIFLLWNPNGSDKVNAYIPRAIKGYLIEDTSLFKPNVGVEKPKDALPPPKVEITKKPTPPEVKTVTIPVKKEEPKPKETKKEFVVKPKEIKKEEPKKKPEKVVVEDDAVEKLKELQNLLKTSEDDVKVPRPDNFSATPGEKGGKGIPLGDAEGIVPNSELEFLLAEYAHNLKTYLSTRWLVTNVKALKANPQAIVYVFVTIDRKGNLLDLRLKKSSGIRSFDEDCMNTIRQAEPLVEPPEKLVPIVVGREIQFECPADDVLKHMGVEE